MNIKGAKRLRSSSVIWHKPLSLLTEREGGDCREAPMCCLSKCLWGWGNPRNSNPIQGIAGWSGGAPDTHTAQRALSAQEHYNLEQLTFKLCFTAHFSPEPCKSHLFLNSQTRVLRGQVGATTLWPPPTASSSPWFLQGISGAAGLDFSHEFKAHFISVCNAWGCQQWFPPGRAQGSGKRWEPPG